MVIFFTAEGRSHHQVINHNQNSHLLFVFRISPSFFQRIRQLRSFRKLVFQIQILVNLRAKEDPCFNVQAEKNPKNPTRMKRTSLRNLLLSDNCYSTRNSTLGDVCYLELSNTFLFLFIMPP